MPTALIVIIGIAAFIGMIVCAKMKEKPQAKPLAGLFLAVLVICAGMYLHNNGIFTGEDKETRDQRASYARFEESTAKALGEYIAKNYGSSKVVIVAAGGADYQKNPTLVKKAENVKKYIPSAQIQDLGYTRNENEMAMMPGATAKEFVDFFKKNADVGVFILLEDMPYDIAQTGIILKHLFDSKGKQKIAVFNGDISSFYPFIKQDFVTAAVVSKPGLKEEDYEKLASENLDEAFAARYLLITSKNVDQFKDNPKIFRK